MDVVFQRMLVFTENDHLEPAYGTFYRLYAAIIALIYAVFLVLAVQKLCTPLPKSNYLLVN